MLPLHLTNKILLGNVREKLQHIPDNSCRTCVTSPPYYGLRDYGTAVWDGGDENCDHKMPRSTNRHRPGDKSATNKGSDPITCHVCGRCGATRIDEQIGMEKTPEEYVEKLVGVFKEVHRILTPDGTLWLNLGDSYNGSGGQGTKPNIISAEANEAMGGKAIRIHSLKAKDLIGIPWMVAFALRAAGWYLRQDIIWHKPNPMPESVGDRCTKSHEYIFLFSKQPKYYFDQEAIRQPLADLSVQRLLQDVENQNGTTRAIGKTNGTLKATAKNFTPIPYLPGRNPRKGVDTKGGNQGSGTGIPMGMHGSGLVGPRKT
jgi:DNA modification methylase